MKHVPNLKGLSAKEISEILDKAAEIKASPLDFAQSLAFESLAMLFQKTSTRTRVSFEVAMAQLGGHAIHLDWAASNFGLSKIEYETEYLSRNVTSIMARLLHHSDLQEVVGASKVPVINGCCEKFHPCQALTDVLTMQEFWEGDVRESHLAYLGVQNNVTNSLVLIFDKLGLQLTLATPELQPSSEAYDSDVQTIINANPRINHDPDARSAVQSADFVYTDTWIDMQYFNDADHAVEQEKRIEEMMPYQLNRELLDGIECRIMHDMPIHPGYEITDDMVRDPRSIIFSQSSNRLHSQKGLLWWLYREAKKGEV